MNCDGEDFWDPRPCFVIPTSEMHQAAELFDLAAKALLKDDLELARTLVLKADMPSICAHVYPIIEKWDAKIHRRRTIPNAPSRLPTNGRPTRKTKPLEAIVFARDGWKCRFCGVRVIWAQALTEFDRKSAMH